MVNLKCDLRCCQGPWVSSWRTRNKSGMRDGDRKPVDLGPWVFLPRPGLHPPSHDWWHDGIFSFCLSSLKLGFFSHVNKESDQTKNKRHHYFIYCHYYRSCQLTQQILLDIPSVPGSELVNKPDQRLDSHGTHRLVPWRPACIATVHFYLAHTNICIII